MGEYRKSQLKGLDLNDPESIEKTSFIRHIRSENATNLNANTSREDYQRKVKKGKITLGPERLSQIAKDREASLDPKVKSARAKKAAETLGFEGRSEAAKKAAETIGTERRKEINRLSREKIDPETKSKVGKIANAASVISRKKMALEDNMKILKHLPEVFSKYDTYPILEMLELSQSRWMGLIKSDLVEEIPVKGRITKINPRLYRKTQ